MVESNICFFDFDNTLYKGHNRYLILDFPEFLVEKGFFNREELKELQKLKTLYSDDKISRDEFAIQVINSYYRGLAGQSKNDISKLGKIFWAKAPEYLWFSYTLPLLRLMKKYTTIILISGSPIEILSLIYKNIGIEALYGTQGVIEKGTYTGTFILEKELATRQAKKRVIREISTTHYFNPATSFAFGDSESDFPLFDAVNANNSYLIVEKNDFDEMSTKGWNIVQRNDSILDNVHKRIASIFPVNQR